MFTRKYKIKSRKVGSKTVFVPMYQNWYSFTWSSLFESDEDYCPTLQEAIEVGMKFIVRDAIYAATGEDVDVNQIEKHEDFELGKELVKEMLEENKKS